MFMPLIGLSASGMLHSQSNPVHLLRRPWWVTPLCPCQLLKTIRASVGFAQPTPQSGAARAIPKKFICKFLGLTGPSLSSPSPALPALSSPVVDTQENLILPLPKKPEKRAASGERKEFERKWSLPDIDNLRQIIHFRWRWVGFFRFANANPL